MYKCLSCLAVGRRVKRRGFPSTSGAKKDVSRSWKGLEKRHVKEPTLRRGNASDDTRMRANFPGGKTRGGLDLWSRVQPIVHENRGYARVVLNRRRYTQSRHDCWRLPTSRRNERRRYSCAHYWILFSTLSRSRTCLLFATHGTVVASLKLRFCGISELITIFANFIHFAFILLNHARLLFGLETQLLTKDGNAISHY